MWLCSMYMCFAELKQHKVQEWLYENNTPYSKNNMGRNFKVAFIVV